MGVKQFLRNVVLNLIRDELKEEIKKEVKDEYANTIEFNINYKLSELIKPKENLSKTAAKKIKEISNKTLTCDEMSVFDIIRSFDILEYKILIEYTDIHCLSEKRQRITAYDARTFYNKIKDFSPMHNYFCGFHFSVNFDGELSKVSKTDVVVNSHNNGIHRSEDIHKIINEIIQFFDENPELLI